MCISVALLAASTAISAVGSFVTAGQQAASAQAESDYRNYQLDVQNKQLEEDRNLAEVQALQQENERRNQARRLRSMNEAFIAGSGVGENRSFLQGTDKANEQALMKDISGLRLQGQVTRGRITDQIAVNRVEGQFAKQKASMIGRQAFTNAAFSAASSVASNAYKFNTYKV